MTNRETLIREIEALFPPDAGAPGTAAVGQAILIQALARNWRDLPEPVLADMAAEMRTQNRSDDRIKQHYAG